MDKEKIVGYWNVMRLQRESRRKYYVYAIYKEGQLCYIGKGVANRMRTSLSKTGGDKCKKLMEGLTSDEAFELERLLINEVGSDSLMNGSVYPGKYTGKVWA